jgi:hypothetical protein
MALAGLTADEANCRHRSPMKKKWKRGLLKPFINNKPTSRVCVLLPRPVKFSQKLSRRQAWNPSVFAIFFLSRACSCSRRLHSQVDDEEEIAMDQLWVNAWNREYQETRNE